MLVETESGVSGFEVDLWKEIAQKIDTSFSFEVQDSFPDQLEKVQNGELDFSLSTITIREDRSKHMDFSYPYYVGGITLLVPLKSELGITQVLKPFVSPLVLHSLFLFVLFVFVFGNILWLLERKWKKPISKNYFPGIFQGMWYAFALKAKTSRFIGGDALHHPGTRFLAIPLWMIGLIMGAIISAQLISEFTLQKMDSNVTSLEDLRGKPVITMEGTTSVAFLKKNGVIPVPHKNLDEMYAALKRGEGVAVVFDYPDMLALEKQGKKEGYPMGIVGGRMTDELYGIAINKKIDPEIRKQIDSIIREMYDNGYLYDLRKKWFQ